MLGAESTGKTSLVQALREHLCTGAAGLRVAAVGEVLREWCDAQGRTPWAHEQDAILRAQHERIAEAAATHDWVVCDTTALMTAVYSTLVFGDEGLQARAAALHARSAAVTLLTALDLPWVADGHQRDGPQVREPVDTLLRTLMRRHGLAFSVVAGQGEFDRQMPATGARAIDTDPHATRNGQSLLLPLAILVRHREKVFSQAKYRGVTFKLRPGPSP